MVPIVSQFEYLAALISIVVAFGMSQMLVSWGRLLKARSRVVGYWVHAAWSGMIVLFMILFWWELWQYRGMESWSFLALLWTILNAMFIVLSAYILIPPVSDEGEIDLRAFYYDSAPLFFVITVLGMISIAVSDLLLDPGRVHWGETASRLAWLPFGVWVAMTKNPKVHAAITVVAVFLYGAFLSATHLR